MVFAHFIAQDQRHLNKTWTDAISDCKRWKFQLFVSHFWVFGNGQQSAWYAMENCFLSAKGSRYFGFLFFAGLTESHWINTDVSKCKLNWMSMYGWPLIFFRVTWGKWRILKKPFEQLRDHRAANGVTFINMKSIKSENSALM